MFGTILLTPVGGGRVVRGSEQVLAHCGHQSWISPQGMEFRRRFPFGGVLLKCTDCVTPEDMASMSETMPGAMTALQEELSPKEMARLRLYLRMAGIKENE